MLKSENCPHCRKPVNAGAIQCLTCKKSLAAPAKREVLSPEQPSISPSTRTLSSAQVDTAKTTSADDPRFKWYSPELYAAVKAFVLQRNEVSTSEIQHHFHIEFITANLMESHLEIEGFLSPPKGNAPRKVSKVPTPKAAQISSHTPSSGHTSPSSRPTSSRQTASSSIYSSPSSAPKRASSSANNSPSKGGSAATAAPANASGCDSALGGCGCIGFLLLVILIAFPMAFIHPSNTSEPTPPSSNTSPSTSQDQDPNSSYHILNDVKNSPWDNSVYPVQRYIEHNVFDRSSLEFIEWGQVVVLRDSPYHYMVRCKYRAKNAFGAYVIEHQIFYLDVNGQVVNVTDWE